MNNDEFLKREIDYKNHQFLNFLLFKNVKIKI